MDSKLIGQMVRVVRKTARLSRVELADLAGVGKTVVFDLEKGKPTVRLQTLLKVLRALNIRLELIPPVGESAHHA